MNTSRNKFIQDFVDGRLNMNAGGTNHDIYDKRLTLRNPRPGFDKIPHCIYFYYVRIDRDGKVRVDHYLHVERNAAGESVEIPYDNVPDILRYLALNGRPSTSPKIPPKDTSNNFGRIPWKYRSYIAIFFDELNWSFHRRANNKAAVVFDPVLGNPNNSFFDAKDVLLELPNRRTGATDQRSAIFFVNHIKLNGDGDDLPAGQEQIFKFDMWLDAQFANSSVTGMAVNFDPGGTNTGPPEDPP